MSCAGGKAATLGVIFFFLVIAGGCARDKRAATELVPDKWSTLAEQSQGHSPAPRRRTGNVTEFQSAGSTPAKTLPSTMVSLKMRNADVKSILRALARISGVSILVTESTRGTLTIDFDYIPWDQAFRTVLNASSLVYVWEGDILHVMTVDDMETSMKTEAVQGKRKAQDMEGKTVEPFVTVMVSIDYADAALLKDSLLELITKDKGGKPRGSIRVDEHNNALVIQAIRDDIDRMLPLIAKIDKPTPQILIKANIVETSKDVARNLGIQWGGQNNGRWNGTGLTINPGVDGSGAPRPFGINFPVADATIQSAGGAMALGLTYGTIGGNALELQLQALQQDGKLNIISSPSIIALDNQKAFTESGERVPYVATTPGTAGAAPTQTVQFIDAVLRLEIIPHVIDGTNLKMKVIVKKDEVDTSHQVQGNPFIIKKNTETVLIAKDGETIVISGLENQKDSSTDTGVPWLKDIPLLGWLFKSHSQDNSLDNVLIFITPHILPVHTEEAAADGKGQPAR